MQIFSDIFRFLPFIAVIMLGGANLHAGASNKSGNPYGNGTFFSTSGTFSGVLRGVNIVGVTQFSTSSNSIINGGALYIYNASAGWYDDQLGVYATMDPSSSSLNALIMTATASQIGYTNTAANYGASNNLSAGGGAFTAHLNTAPPNQTFSGSGNLTEVINGGADPTGSTNFPFSITGCRISSQ
jgi:hypothetical protein